MSSLDCLIGPFAGLGVQTILVRLLGAILTLLAVWYIGSRKRPPPTKSMAPASQAMASRETAALFVPFLRLRRGRYEGSDQSYPAEYNPFTNPDAQPSRGSPSSTGGQQAAPRRPPTPPNPFDEETSSAGKNPFVEETSSAGKNPFGDDIDGDDKNNPFFN